MIRKLGYLSFWFAVILHFLDASSISRRDFRSPLVIKDGKKKVAGSPAGECASSFLWLDEFKTVGYMEFLIHYFDLDVGLKNFSKTECAPRCCIRPLNKIFAFGVVARERNLCTQSTLKFKYSLNHFDMMT